MMPLFYGRPHVHLITRSIREGIIIYGRQGLICMMPVFYGHPHVHLITHDNRL